MTRQTSLPILDLSRLDGSPEDRTAFLADLRSVARRVGFFYLTGHGVPQSLIDDVLATSRRFFALPEADKLDVEMVHSPHFRGYTRAGWEITRGKQDWREQFDINAEREARRVGPDDPPWWRLQGPNQWPPALPQLKPVLLEWQAQLTEIAKRLLQALAVALGQDRDVFAPIYERGPNQHIKIIRYPGRDRTESDQGVGAHKDSGFLTLLLQDVERGLQVETDDGWVDVTPIPGTFVINIGEVLELASDGYLRATVHRVVTPPAGTERLSVAYFFGASLDAQVPLLTLSPELAAEATGPERDPDNPLFTQVGRNFLKGRLRSHPDVAARHYADLVGPDAARQPATAY